MVNFGKCPNDDHDYHYTEYDDGHEFIVCTLCSYVFVDTRNRLSVYERRELVGTIATVFIAIPLLWGFIMIAWGVLGE